MNQRPVPKVRLFRALALVGALGLAAPLEVDARPGGGHSSSSSHSYSGGSRSSSHSWGGSSRSSSSRSSGGRSYGGGGGVGPVNDFMALVCGLVFVFALLLWAMYSKAREREQRFDTIVAAPPRPRPSGPRWADLRARDPDFSAVLFEDFVYALYARAPGLVTRSGGLNESESGRPVLVDLWRVSQSVTKQLVLLQSKGFASLEIEGSLLQDPTKAAVGISRYMRTTHL